MNHQWFVKVFLCQKFVLYGSCGMAKLFEIKRGFEGKLLQHEIIELICGKRFTSEWKIIVKTMKVLLHTVGWDCSKKATQSLHKLCFLATSRSQKCAYNLSKSVLDFLKFIPSRFFNCAYNYVCSIGIYAGFL